MSALQVGDAAPEFALPSQNGALTSLMSFRGRPVVLYFYPRDNTPVCTKESCKFRDDYEDFKSAGAEVIGVSSDSPESHREFAKKFRLPFLLLSDTDSNVKKLYGVSGMFGILPSRMTFVIDAEGKILHIFNSLLNGEKHVSEALRILSSKVNAGCGR